MLHSTIRFSPKELKQGSNESLKLILSSTKEKGVNNEHHNLPFDSGVNPESSAIAYLLLAFTLLNSRA